MAGDEENVVGNMA